MHSKELYKCSKWKKNKKLGIEPNPCDLSKSCYQLFFSLKLKELPRTHRQYTLDLHFINWP